MSFFASIHLHSSTGLLLALSNTTFHLRCKILMVFCLRNLALVRSIFCEACRCCNINMTSVCHGDDRKCSDTCGSSCSLCFFPYVDNSAIMCRLIPPHLYRFMSLVSHWPLIIFVGLVSKSYSSNTAIHFPLLPSGSSLVRISFTALVGT